MKFQLGSEHGRAQLSADGTLTIVTNPVDLRALDNEFINIADFDDPELPGLIHIHLQDGFISWIGHVGDVIDIVFERLDE